MSWTVPPKDILKLFHLDLQIDLMKIWTFELKTVFIPIFTKMFFEIGLYFSDWLMSNDNLQKIFHAFTKNIQQSIAPMLDAQHAQPQQ